VEVVSGSGREVRGKVVKGSRLLNRKFERRSGGKERNGNGK
jgi:hypothetical protein